ncbi:integrase domain-containing protein [Ruminococcus sp. NK3A76]|uniref:integrase domain-containing protein n=1 Tax=Ruminococcus sp. NK3A76 TaxID=877411 RepID=UPI00048F9B0E|nr:integrase domain-containing protein [Ruminococcus sp. NK3A76]
MKQRTRQLTYALRANLESMAAYGESKKLYKDKTNAMRRQKYRELIYKGISRADIHKELLHIDAAKDKIFSYSTMKNYIRFVKDFAAFVYTKTSTSRVSVEDSIKYIRPYIDSLISKGDSPNTINLKLSAVCKATGQYVVDYTHPIRRYSDVTRSTKAAVRDKYNDKRAAAALELNRSIGLRRNELARVSINDIYLGEKCAYIYSKGKGGKNNITYISDPAKLDILYKYMSQAITEGRETLLSKEQMNHDADLHHARAMCAVDEYNRILQDIHKNPEQREFYKSYIKNIFKKYNKPLLEDLDKPYYLRGAGKTLCISQGKSYIFDRVAVLYVSLTILHHFRSDTTVQHYLIK